MFVCLELVSQCRPTWEGVAAVAAVIGLFITALGAVAVFRVSHRANELALLIRSEKKTAEFQEGRIILSFVAPELRDVQVKLSALKAFLEAEGIEQALPHRQDIRQHIVEEALRIKVPQSESCLSRMHVLPPVLGASLAELVARIQILRRAAITMGRNEGELAAEESKLVRSTHRLMLVACQVSIDEIDLILESKRRLDETDIS